MRRVLFLTLVALTGAAAALVCFAAVQLLADSLLPSLELKLTPVHSEIVIGSGAIADAALELPAAEEPFDYVAVLVGLVAGVVVLNGVLVAVLRWTREFWKAGGLLAGVSGVLVLALAVYVRGSADDLYSALLDGGSLAFACLAALAVDLAFVSRLRP